MRILIDTQLSNYTRDGQFVLACDSGWQMCAARVRELLALDPELTVDITVARDRLDDPATVTPEVALDPRVQLVELPVEANALATRYDFPWAATARALGLVEQRTKRQLRYDVAYVNDPMRFRALRALIATEAGYAPRFTVHSHFVDLPSKPKFPTDVSLWWGQLEAAARADWNFWQCDSTLREFLREAATCFHPRQLSDVAAKSSAWDDGYSIAEIRKPVDASALRPELLALRSQLLGRVLVFVPNRVGGGGRSSDYTRCGTFLRDHLPEVRQLLGQAASDVVVLAGNPSLKFSNAELASECGTWPIGPAPLSRDELRWVMSQSDFVVGLYDSDAYGSTASREAIELGAHPIWIDCNEYASIAREAGCSRILARADFTDLPQRCANLIGEALRSKRGSSSAEHAIAARVSALQAVVRQRCSVESTTKSAFGKLIGASSSRDADSGVTYVSIGDRVPSTSIEIAAGVLLRRCASTKRVTGVTLLDESAAERAAVALEQWPWLAAVVSSELTHAAGAR